MPSTVIEDGSSDSFAEPVEVPDDGEGATSASLEDTFVQVLANRSRRHNTIITSSGVPRIATSLTRTALKAVTGMATGDVRWVPGLGLYRYDSLEATADDGQPWYVEPNTGVGRWVHELAGLVAATSLGTGAKIATVTSGGKLIEPVPNRVVAIGGVVFAQAGDTIGSLVTAAHTATSYTDVTGLAVSVAAQVGDILLVSAHGFVATGGVVDVFAKLVKVDGGVTSDVLGCWQWANGSNVANASRHFSWPGQQVTAANLGTLTVKVQTRTGTGASSVWVEKPAAINYVHIRP